SPRIEPCEAPGRRPPGVGRRVRKMYARGPGAAPPGADPSGEPYAVPSHLAGRPADRGGPGRDDPPRFTAGRGPPYARLPGTRALLDVPGVDRGRAGALRPPEPRGAGHGGAPRLLPGTPPGLPDHAHRRRALAAARARRRGRGARGPVEAGRRR